MNYFAIFYLNSIFAANICALVIILSRLKERVAKLAAAFLTLDSLPPARSLLCTFFPPFLPPPPSFPAGGGAGTELFVIVAQTSLIMQLFIFTGVFNKRPLEIRREGKTKAGAAPECAPVTMFLNYYYCRRVLLGGGGLPDQSARGGGATITSARS